MEKKKDKNEEIRKKHDKIMNTLQNLIRLGEECKTSSSPNKYRIDSKNHLKQRKVLNEYYVGTEESKNNTSTFIDKQEYYKSILESKNVLINSKIENTETNVEESKSNINNIRNLMISQQKSNDNNNNNNSNKTHNIKYDNYFDKNTKKNIKIK